MTLQTQNTVLIIAEAGSNWKSGTYDQDMERTEKLIKKAKESGADAIKFQSYKAETIASINSPSYWDLNKEPTTSQFKLFKKYCLFRDTKQIS